MERYEYRVVDVAVPVEHKTQTTLAAEAQAVINRHAKEGWRLHTYRLTQFGRLPGFLAIKFENVCHLVFERATDEGRGETKDFGGEKEAVTTEGKVEGTEVSEELRQRREQNRVEAEEKRQQWLRENSKGDYG